MREFLEGQAAAKQRSLDSIEQSLQKYMKTAGVVSLDAEANKLVEQLAEIEANRDAIELEIATKVSDACWLQGRAGGPGAECAQSHQCLR